MTIAHWLKQEQNTCRVNNMYRSILKEIDAVNPQKGPKGLKPVGENEIVIGELTDQLFQHRILICDYREKISDVRARIGDATEAHKVDHEDKTLSEEELKSRCDAYSKKIEELQGEGEVLSRKIKIIDEIFQAELEEQIPETKKYSSVVLREDKKIVGVRKVEDDENVVNSLRAALMGLIFP